MEEPMFSIVRQGATKYAPRLGRLVTHGRNVLDTPNYLASTSRGSVPHLTPDTLSTSTTISGVYTSLEDFVEKAPQNTPPICQPRPSATHGRMRQFIAIPPPILLVLGSRRSPPVIAPPATSNTDKNIAICTSVGFRYLDAESYARYAEDLDADIVLSLADVPHGRALGSKRIEAATDRSIEWLQYHLQQRRNRGDNKAALFATLLPVPVRNQQYYAEVVEDSRAQIQGLAIHSLDTLQDLPDALADLPRLDLTEAQTPLQLLGNVGQGVDISVVPFVDTATDAGLALDFAFGSSQAAGSEPASLAIDMWTTHHATDLGPLQAGCTCYACTTHHRAYVHHLLNAKEMLGWVLLQVHNHHVLDRFFKQIRSSIERDTFTADVEAFTKLYAPDFPHGTGQGPRIRGYQRKSEGRGEPKANQAAFVKYEAAQAGKALMARKPAKAPISTSTDILDVDFDLKMLDEQNELDIADQPEISNSVPFVQDGPVT